MRRAALLLVLAVVAGPAAAQTDTISARSVVQNPLRDRWRRDEGDGLRLARAGSGRDRASCRRRLRQRQRLRLQRGGKARGRHHRRQGGQPRGRPRAAELVGRPGSAAGAARGGAAGHTGRAFRLGLSAERRAGDRPAPRLCRGAGGRDDDAGTGVLVGRSDAAVSRSALSEPRHPDPAGDDHDPAWPFRRADLRRCGPGRGDRGWRAAGRLARDQLVDPRRHLPARPAQLHRPRPRRRVGTSPAVQRLFRDRGQERQPRPGGTRCRGLGSGSPDGDGQRRGSSGAGHAGGGGGRRPCLDRGGARSGRPGSDRLGPAGLHRLQR